MIDTIMKNSVVSFYLFFICGFMYHNYKGELSVTAATFYDSRIGISYAGFYLRKTENDYLVRECDAFSFANPEDVQFWKTIANNSVDFRIGSWLSVVRNQPYQVVTYDGYMGTETHWSMTRPSFLEYCLSIELIKKPDRDPYFLDKSLNINWFVWINSPTNPLRSIDLSSTVELLGSGLPVCYERYLDATVYSDGAIISTINRETDHGFHLVWIDSIVASDSSKSSIKVCAQGIENGTPSAAYISTMFVADTQLAADDMDSIEYEYRYTADWIGLPIKRTDPWKLTCVDRLFAITFVSTPILFVTGAYRQRMSDATEAGPRLSYWIEYANERGFRACVAIPDFPDVEVDGIISLEYLALTHNGFYDPDMTQSKRYVIVDLYVYYAYFDLVGLEAGCDLLRKMLHEDCGDTFNLECDCVHREDSYGMMAHITVSYSMLIWKTAGAAVGDVSPFTNHLYRNFSDTIRQSNDTNGTDVELQQLLLGGRTKVPVSVAVRHSCQYKAFKVGNCSIPACDDVTYGLLELKAEAEDNSLQCLQWSRLTNCNAPPCNLEEKLWVLKEGVWLNTVGYSSWLVYLIAILIISGLSVLSLALVGWVLWFILSRFQSYKRFREVQNLIEKMYKDLEDAE